MSTTTLVARAPGAPPLRFAGEPGAVHVWSRLALGQGDTVAGYALLDAGERARAERFRFERDRHRFVQRHAFTRSVLAGYLGMDPASIRFAAGPFGRPELDPPGDLSFNVSQADDLTVVAVARGGRVGVDVERLRPIDDVMELSADVLTDAETASVRSLPASARSAAFLALWTRKESVVKASGEGLSIPLRSFSVLSHGGAGRPRAAEGDLPYVVAPLPALPGYVGAAALAGSDIAVTHVRPLEAGRC